MNLTLQIISCDCEIASKLLKIYKNNFYPRHFFKQFVFCSRKQFLSLVNYELHFDRIQFYEEILTS